MRIFLKAFVAVFVLCAVTPARGQTPSYTLWCRGGGPMQTVVTGVASPSGLPGTTLRIAFRTMRTAATTATPPALGQCSWLDRPLNSAEPTVMLYDSRDMSPGGSLSAAATFDVSGLAAVDFSGAGTLAADAQYLLSHARAGQEFRVEVYNTGRGTMKITHVDR